ncbi:hypothetical protein [Nonomuraea sp. KM90]|uniref:hypothetical protein n=1 Tax=Nonomuraea sp. KM90 TaxID=3457428 RepID=UPI003FCD5213
MSPDLAQVVARISARVAPESTHRVTMLVDGVRVDLAIGADARRRWISTHRVLRELLLVGWHVRARPDHLLVGGWSAVNLAHRVQTLGAGVQAMRQVSFAVEAVLAAVERHHRARLEASTAEVLTGAGAEVTAWYQRWPVRLAELEEADREADRPLIHRLLRRSQELERHLLPLCARQTAVVHDAVAALGDLLLSAGRAADARAQLLQRVGERFAEGGCPPSSQSSSAPSRGGS